MASPPLDRDMFDTADPDPLARALAGRAFADPFPWQFLTRLAELPGRLGGSPGERRAADLAREALPGDPRVEPFGVERWERGTTDLTATVERPDGPVERSFEAVALPYSPAGTVAAPLVDVGHGTPDEFDAADCEGRVAVARTDSPADSRFVHRMESYGHAIEAGAAAFVFANHVPGQLPPTGALRFGGEPSEARRSSSDGSDGGDAPIPGVGVSRETGAWLTDYAADDATVRLDVDTTTTAGESRNVVTRLGPATDERVLLVAHLDAHDTGEGALDNGAGLTVATTAARLLAAVVGDPDAPDPLDRGVTVAAVGCEETGLLGSEALAASLRDELDGGLDAVHAVLNVDGAGRARDLRAFTHGADAVARAAREVTDAVGQPLAVESTPHPYSDHWPFLRAGVPALQLHSEPPDDDGSWGPRGLPVAHTRADTLDKVDLRNVREHAGLCALLVDALSRSDLPRVDAGTLADRLREADAEAGMRAAGIWPDGW
jgi:Zn-dependent M28 family amino/carboxypeptidase